MEAQKEKEFNKLLVEVQQKTKIGKNKYNDFGNYKYKTCSDILEAAKEYALPLGLSIKLSDKMIMLGDRFYIEATASITDGVHVSIATAYARESLTKKGMDESQITGSASTYARKVALSGLLALDDTDDADATNKHEKDNDQTDNKKSTLSINKDKPKENSIDKEYSYILYGSKSSDTYNIKDELKNDGWKFDSNLKVYIIHSNNPDLSLDYPNCTKKRFTRKEWNDEMEAYNKEKK